MRLNATGVRAFRWLGLRRALCVDRAGLEGLLKGVKTENSKLFKNETWLKGAIDVSIY